MKILILTPINEVESSIVYESIQREFEGNKNLNILCFPLFAFMKAEADGKLYIPTYFTIIKAFNEDKKLRKALLDKTDTIIIGNLYKEKEKEDFDFIIAYNYNEDEVFDTTLEAIKNDEIFKDFIKKINLDFLYTPENRNLNMPTLEHLILFLKGAIKNGKN